MLSKKKAFVIVDLQNDFCKGGSLAVPGGENIIPLINQLQLFFPLVVASQDWHPQNHVSFASNHNEHKVGDVLKVGRFSQILWPDHCVQDSTGADFHQQLNLERIDKVVHKGTNENIDSYSVFYDNARLRSTGLENYLHQNQIKDLYFAGLATDYCVKYSVLDAVELGFNVYVIVDACRGIELKQGDIDDAFEEMRTAGVELICAQEIFARAKSKLRARDYISSQT